MDRQVGDGELEDEDKGAELCAAPRLVTRQIADSAPFEFLNF